MQAAEGGGGDSVELDSDAATAISMRHEMAADRLLEACADLPSVDGGLADPELLAILTCVVSTAGELATINTFGAETMRAVEAHLLGVDSAVADAYSSVDPEPTDGASPLLPPEILHSPFPPGWAP